MVNYVSHTLPKQTNEWWEFWDYYETNPSDIIYVRKFKTKKECLDEYKRLTAITLSQKKV